MAGRLLSAGAAPPLCDAAGETWLSVLDCSDGLICNKLLSNTSPAKSYTVCERDLTEIQYFVWSIITSCFDWTVIVVLLILFTQIISLNLILYTVLIITLLLCTYRLNFSNIFCKRNLKLCLGLHSGSSRTIIESNITWKIKSKI